MLCQNTILIINDINYIFSVGDQTQKFKDDFLLFDTSIVLYFDYETLNNEKVSNERNLCTSTRMSLNYSSSISDHLSYTNSTGKYLI